MGSPFYFEKQPGEEYNIEIEFVALRLESGESVVSTVVSAVLCRDDSDATADVIDSNSESGGVVTIRVKNGTDGERYGITARVTTDAAGANIYEADVVMKVKNR